MKKYFILSGILLMLVSLFIAGVSVAKNPSAAMLQQAIGLGSFQLDYYKPMTIDLNQGEPKLLTMTDESVSQLRAEFSSLFDQRDIVAAIIIRMNDKAVDYFVLRGFMIQGGKMIVVNHKLSAAWNEFGQRIFGNEYRVAVFRQTTQDWFISSELMMYTGKQYVAAVAKNLLRAEVFSGITGSGPLGNAGDETMEEIVDE